MIRSLIEAVWARIDAHRLATYRRLLPEEYASSGAGPGDPLYAVRNKIVFAHMRTLVGIRMRGRAYVERVQSVRLRALLKSARKAVWWRKYLAAYNLSSVRSMGQLAQLPTVKRSQLASVPIDQLLSRAQENVDAVRQHTSGSTDGVPFSVVYERNPIDGASYLGVLLKEHGFPLESLADKHFIIAVNLFGNRIADLPCSRSMYACPIEWSSPEKQQEGLDRLLATAASMDRWVLFTHVTELFMLIELLRSRGARMKGLSACLLIGHRIEPEQGARAEAFLECPIVSVYGTREFGLVLAGSCRNARDVLHIIGEHAYIEVLDPEGKPLPPGEVGDVHLTGLNNTLMPLIRYDIGDRGRIIEAPCGCPNPNIRFQIENKTTDMLAFPSGEVLARRVFRVFVEESLATNVLAYQVVQEGERLVRIRAVLKESAIPQAALVLERIKTEIDGQHILPGDVEVRVDRVDALPATKGKHKPFISLAAFRASQASAV